MAVGLIERIWRYPVKSLGGERLDVADLDGRGIVGDRLYAVRDTDGKFGSGKNSRRFRRMPGLLELRSRYTGGTPELLDPDGTPVPDPGPYLRKYLGLDVDLVREGEVSHFDKYPFTLLTTATLDWVREAVPDVPVDERRFRPNLLVRTPPGTPPFVEDQWLGKAVRIGETVRVLLEASNERCVMVNAEQHDLPHTSQVLKVLTEAHDMRLDAACAIETPGPIRVGDPLDLA